MALTIACPGCGRRLQLPEQFHSETVKCPWCQLTFAAAEARPATLASRAAAPSPAAENIPTLERWQNDDRRRPIRSPFARSAPPEKRFIARAFVVLAVVLVGFGALAVGIAVVGSIVMAPPITTYPPRASFPAATNLPPLGRAQPQSEQELNKDLVVLFANLGAAFRQGNAHDIVRYFALERTIEEFSAQGIVGPINANDQFMAVSAARTGWASSLQREAATKQWTDTEIRNVRRLNDAEIVVIARHTRLGQPALKMRWWLTQRSGPWQVYDREVVDVGWRLSTTVPALLGENPGLADTELRQAIKVLGEAVQLANADHNTTAAEQKLRQIEGVALSHQLEALRQLVLGVIRLNDGHPKEALVALNKALNLHADLPLVDLLKGTAFNQLGQYDRAQVHLKTYHDLVGDDAAVCFQLAKALHSQQRFPESARLYRTTLDLNPQQPDAVLGLLRSLTGAEKNDDLGTRLEALDDRRKQFDILAADCERRKIPQLLEPLAETMYRLDPDYAPASYYVAVVRAQLHQGDKAAEPFKAALAKQTDEHLRADYVTGFLTAMAAAGKYVDAYVVVRDEVAAFRFLAAAAMKSYRTDELHFLVAAHAKRHAGDPFLTLYQAEVYAREGRYALADKEFAAALLRPLGDEVLKPFRGDRVLARYHTGHALEAYRDIGPRAETFPQLANLALADENNDVLQTLLDEHTKNDPESLDLLCYRSRLKVRQGDVAEAVALFKKVQAKELPEEKRSDVLYEILSDFVAADQTLPGYRAAADAKEALQILADELSEQGRREEMPLLLAAHREREPNDPLLAYYQGQVHLEAKEWDQAAKVLGEGMKKAPKEMQQQFRWPYLRAMCKAGRALQAYYAEPEPRSTAFNRLAWGLADKKGNELAALVKAHRPHAADDPDLLFFDALSHVLAGKPDEATPLLRQALLAQTNDYQRNQYVRHYLTAMDDAGHGLDGYRVVKDQAAAFDILARRWTTAKKDKELATFLAVVSWDHGADPLWHYYTGELQLRQGDATAASKSFAAAMAAAKPPEDWRYRNGLYRARIKLGQATAVYKLFGPESFSQLAGLCLADKDAQQLQALIDAHRQAKPDDSQLPMWDLEILWLKHDYQGVLKLLAERREDVFDLTQNRWKADDHRLRSLVRLKRTKDAVSEAEPFLRTRAGNRLLAILAYAADGDVKEATAVLQKTRPTPYFLRSCYRDEDLGPLLRSEAFKELRDKFPEPKEDKSEGLYPDDY